MAENKGKKFRPMWIGKIDESVDRNWLPENLRNVKPLITGRAIHPVKTHHPNEWPETRVYLEEELAKAAKGWIGTTPTFEHAWEINGWKVVAAEYSDGELKYAIQPKEDNVLQEVRNGKIKHASVGFEWMVPGGGIKFVNGIAPYGFKPVDIALLRDLPPGDPTSTVQLWESVAKKFKEQIPAQPVVPVGPVTIEQKVAALDDKLAKIEKLLANLYGLTGHSIQEVEAALTWKLGR